MSTPSAPFANDKCYGSKSSMFGQSNKIRGTIEYWIRVIHRLPADVQMAVMHCNISKKHIIFCRHVDHKCYYEAKWIKYTGVVWLPSIASLIAAG